MRVPLVELQNGISACEYPGLLWSSTRVVPPHHLPVTLLLEDDFEIRATQSVLWSVLEPTSGRLGTAHHTLSRNGSQERNILMKIIL